MNSSDKMANRLWGNKKLEAELFNLKIKHHYPDLYIRC